MKRQGRAVLAVMMALAASGCRASVHQLRVERVDQSLADGNRGYLIGTPPPAVDRGAPTRDITELEVRLPSGATRTRQPGVAPQSAAPAAAETAAAEPVPAGRGTIEFLHPEPAADAAASRAAGSSAPATFERYTVKKGDSLWKIAKRFYGDAYQWRRIYDANRGQLSNPNRVQRGMTLKIPMDAASHPFQAGPSAPAESDLK